MRSRTVPWLRGTARHVAFTAVSAAGLAALAFAGPAQAAQSPQAAAPHWSIAYRSHSAAGNYLVSVTALTKTDAWAVGATNKNQPVILNWNGKAWKPVSVPGTSGFDPVAVRAASPGNVWITGTSKSGAGVAHVWNGTTKSWRTISLPVNFYDAAVISATDVWGYGQNGFGCTTNPADTCLYHWNGKVWSGTQVAGTSGDITAAGPHAWFAGLTNVRTVNSGSTGVPAIYELTGGTVRKVSAPSARVANGVEVAAAPNGRLWLGTMLPANEAPVLFHWTGKTWTGIGIPATIGGQPRFIEANLAYDGGSGVWWGPFSHWTGSKWVGTFPDTGLGGYGFALSWVSAIPGSASIWAAGGITVTKTSENLDSLVAVYGSLP
jgi:hypothetical protein